LRNIVYTFHAARQSASIRRARRLTAENATVGRTSRLIRVQRLACGSPAGQRTLRHDAAPRPMDPRALARALRVSELAPWHRSRLGRERRRRRATPDRGPCRQPAPSRRQRQAGAPAAARPRTSPGRQRRLQDGRALIARLLVARCRDAQRADAQRPSPRGRLGCWPRARRGIPCVERHRLHHALLRRLGCRRRCPQPPTVTGVPPLRHLDRLRLARATRQPIAAHGRRANDCHQDRGSPRHGVSIPEPADREQAFPGSIEVQRGANRPLGGERIGRITSGSHPPWRSSA